jgi:hypothetical protein
MVELRVIARQQPLLHFSPQTMMLPFYLVKVVGKDPDLLVIEELGLEPQAAPSRPYRASGPHRTQLAGGVPGLPQLIDGGGVEQAGSEGMSCSIYYTVEGDYRSSMIRVPANYSVAEALDVISKSTGRRFLEMSANSVRCGPEQPVALYATPGTRIIVHQSDQRVRGTAGRHVGPPRMPDRTAGSLRPARREQLPRLDGISAARAAEQHPTGTREIPVLPRPIPNKGRISSA